MRKTALILAAAVLYSFLSIMPAYTADLGEAVGRLSAESMKCQILIYTLCSSYYKENGKWPKDKQELEAFFEKSDNKDSKESIDYLTKVSSYELTPLDNGDLLIKGGFNKEITKGQDDTDMFRFSIIAHKSEKGFSFKPSDKAKDMPNSLIAPFKFKSNKGPK